MVELLVEVVKLDEVELLETVEGAALELLGSAELEELDGLELWLCTETEGEAEVDGAAVNELKLVDAAAEDVDCTLEDVELGVAEDEYWAGGSELDEEVELWAPEEAEVVLAAAEDED